MKRRTLIMLLDMILPLLELNFEHENWNRTFFFQIPLKGRVEGYETKRSIKYYTFRVTLKSSGVSEKEFWKYFSIFLKLNFCIILRKIIKKSIVVIYVLIIFRMTFLSAFILLYEEKFFLQMVCWQIECRRRVEKPYS